MGRKRHTPEEIIGKLCEAEVLLAQGRSVAEAARAIGVTEQSYYRWRKEFGGLKLDQAKRLKELERENARLRKAVADLTLDKLILKEAASGNWCAPPAAGAGSSTFAVFCPSRIGACARCWANPARRSVSRPSPPRTRRRSRPRSWRWPSATAAAATAGSRRCCARR